VYSAVKENRKTNVFRVAFFATAAFEVRVGAITADIWMMIRGRLRNRLGAPNESDAP
jgi:hypothetical protein